MHKNVRVFIDYDELISDMYDFLSDLQVSCNISISNSRIIFKTSNSKSYSKLSSNYFYRRISGYISTTGDLSMGSGYVSYGLDMNKVFIYSKCNKYSERSILSKKVVIDTRDVILTILMRSGFFVSASDILISRIICFGMDNKETYMYELLMYEDCVSDVHSILVDKLSNRNNILINSKAAPDRVRDVNIFKERVVLLNS